MQPFNRPNIIFIVLDTVRAKSLSCYGNSWNSSPCLDSFAEKATLCTNVVSPSGWSSPSLASLFTGLYASEHGTHGYNLDFCRQDIALAKLLRDSGYRTAGFLTCFMISQEFGFDYGFEQFYDLTKLFQLSKEVDVVRGDEFKQLSYKSQKLFYLLKKTLNLANTTNTLKSVINKFYGFCSDPNKDSTKFSIKTLELAKNWIRNNSDPYFVYLNLRQAHNQFNPPSHVKKELNIEYTQNFITPFQFYGNRELVTDEQMLRQRVLYEAEVYFQDQLLGGFLNFLRERKDYDNTLVVVTSDHGEHFGEHDHTSHLFSLYNEITHVPMVVKYPLGIKSAGTDKRLLQTHDLYWTACELAKIHPVHKSKYSFSFLQNGERELAISQLLGCKFTIENFINRIENFKPDNFLYNRSLISLVSKDGYKYIQPTKGNEELFNIKQDYTESDNLVNKDNSVELVTNFRASIESIRSELGYNHVLERFKDSKDWLDPKKKEQITRELIRLGYMSAESQGKQSKAKNKENFINKYTHQCKNNKPNVVLIVLDQFRRDFLKTHPVFDKLAQRGTFLSNSIVYAPYTFASMPAIFSGVYGSNNGIDAYYKTKDFKNDQFQTLTDVLKKAGYLTIGDTNSKLNLPNYGFDHLYEHDEYSEDITKRHLKLIKSLKGKRPLFLYLHYSQIHAKLVTEIIKVFDQYDPRFFSKLKKNKDRYSGFVRAAGDYLEQIFASLVENQLDKNTLLVVLTDHGSSIGERPGERAYGVFTYDYTIKNFCYLVANNLPQGLEITDQVRSIDFMPTILELLGIHSSNKFDGQSLLKVIKDRVPFEKEAFIQTGGLDGPTPSPYNPNVHAVRFKDWKYIYNSTNNNRELYYLVKDQQENNNLCQKYADLADLFHSRVEALRNREGENLVFYLAFDQIINQIKDKDYKYIVR